MKSGLRPRLARSAGVAGAAAVALLVLATHGAPGGSAAGSLAAGTNPSGRHSALADGTAASRAAPRASPIRHVIEVMLENHTFDNLFARFPGADGVRPGKELLDPNAYFSALPPVSPGEAPPNEGDVLGEINNSRVAEQMAMDYEPGHGYEMDHYTVYPQDGLSAITLFGPGLDPNLQYLARHYELADRNFQPAIAPTLPNILYTLAGTAGGLTYNSPFPTRDRFDSIFDQLAAARRSWRIYFGVPLPALAASFWYSIIPPGTASDITTVSRFLADAASGRLPSFSFIRPGAGYSEEPPEDVEEGDAWLGQIVRAVADSPDWASTALFVTYDEGGGFYDHVAPPVVTAYGYGTRTPLVVVSPYARHGVFAAETTNVSILSFVEHLFGLPAASGLDARQNDLARAFDFGARRLAAPVPPLAPPATIGFYGPNDLSDLTPNPIAPGNRLVVNMRANTAGLIADTKLSGTVRLALSCPRGVARPGGFPRRVKLVRGAGYFAASFQQPGYYRIAASGPGGARGFTTIDVGVSPDTGP